MYRGVPMSAVRVLLSMVVAIALLGVSPAAAQMIGEGEPFPSWSLKDHEGKTVSSESLRGRSYLLWYYPAAMTPGCTKEGQALRDHHAKFAAKGVEILGISFDEPEKNAQFVAAENFPYRLVSDDGSLAVKVGAASSPGQGYTRRISYLVGPDGRVQKAYSSVNPSAHAQQVLGDLPTS